MISANDLRNVEIKEAESGYSIEEVNTVLNEAASTIEQYEEEQKALYHKLEVLAAKIEEYRTEEDSIKTALITAQKMADRITKDASDEAEKLVSESRAQAEATISESKEKSDKIVSEARDYSAALIKQKTDEAEAVVADAEKKSNEAINSSQIVAQNILDQAKEISDELIKKSKEENEAYEVLNATLRKNAADFIENLKGLYQSQLDALGSAKLYSTEESREEQNLGSVQSEVSSLVSEIDEIKNSIPSEVKLEKPQYEEKEEIAQPEITEPVTQEEAPVQEDETAPAQEAAPTETEEEIIKIDEEPEEELDPMAAVEAFSADEITPIDKSSNQVFEITEEPKKDEEESLFDEKLPFESYFHVKTEDAHLDKTQTISLIPPDDDEDDDDDAPKFKGFFKKKK